MEQPHDPRRRKAHGQNPMDEENFPDRSPTRDAVEREMREPGNLRGPASGAPRRTPPTKELDEEEE